MAVLGQILSQEKGIFLAGKRPYVVSKALLMVIFFVKRIDLAY